MSAVHKFGHEAMATTFEIFLASDDEAFAASMAREAFALLDRLEEQLSRFRPHSDVAIINALEVGESVRLSIPAFDCLKLAFQVSSETGGAFDVSLAPVMDRIRNDKGEIVEFQQDVLDDAFAELSLIHI